MSKQTVIISQPKITIIDGDRHYIEMMSQREPFMPVCEEDFDSPTFGEVEDLKSKFVQLKSVIDYQDKQFGFIESAGLWSRIKWLFTGVETPYIPRKQNTRQP